MTIETTITERRTIRKEITLPYFSKNPSIESYYMVRDDESVLKVMTGKFDAGITLVKKTPYGNAFLLDDAVAYPQITREEFEEATIKALAFMDEALTQLQPV